MANMAIEPAWTTLENLTKNNFEGIEMDKHDNFSLNLGAVATHIGGTGGNYLSGDNISALGCIFEPQLLYVRVARNHWQEYDIPRDLNIVNSFLIAMFRHKEWSPIVCGQASIVYEYVLFT
jgi:hypothetical protein